MPYCRKKADQSLNRFALGEMVPGVDREVADRNPRFGDIANSLPAKRSPVRTIPDEDRFPLVRDSNRRRLFRRDLTDATVDHRLDAEPNCKWVLLNPGRMWKGDFHRDGGSGQNLSVTIDDNSFGIGRPLVNRQN